MILEVHICPVNKRIHIVSEFSIRSINKKCGKLLGGGSLSKTTLSFAISTFHLELKPPFYPALLSLLPYSCVILCLAPSPTSRCHPSVSHPGLCLKIRDFLRLLRGKPPLPKFLLKKSLEIWSSRLLESTTYVLLSNLALQNNHNANRSLRPTTTTHPLTTNSSTQKWARQLETAEGVMVMATIGAIAAEAAAKRKHC